MLFADYSGFISNLLHLAILFRFTGETDLLLICSILRTRESRFNLHSFDYITLCLDERPINLLLNLGIFFLRGEELILCFDERIIKFFGFDRFLIGVLNLLFLEHLVRLIAIVYGIPVPSYLRVGLVENTTFRED